MTVRISVLWKLSMHMATNGQKWSKTATYYSASFPPRTVQFFFRLSVSIYSLTTEAYFIYQIGPIFQMSSLGVCNPCSVPLSKHINKKPYQDRYVPFCSDQEKIGFYRLRLQQLNIRFSAKLQTIFSSYDFHIFAKIWTVNPNFTLQLQNQVILITTAAASMLEFPSSNKRTALR